MHDVGMSGLKGFVDHAGGRVLNRTHDRFRHSDYFYEGNYRTAWIPFLLGENPAEPINLKPPATNRRFRRNVVIAILVLLAVAIVWILR